MIIKDIISSALVLMFWVSCWGADEASSEVNDDAKRKNKTVELTPQERDIIEKGATEPPFNNPYWDEKREGIYVDRMSGKPLFSSTAKFDSGTGWPSFYEPIAKGEIIERIDQSHFMNRTEIRAKDSNAHLGHLFKDGPQPTGMRYCVNSASLRFVPVDDLEQEGYGEFLKLFKEEAHGAESNDTAVSPQPVAAPEEIALPTTTGSVEPKAP